MDSEGKMMKAGAVTFRATHDNALLKLIPYMESGDINLRSVSLCFYISMVTYNESDLEG